MYISRAMEESVRTISRAFPVLLLTGARQVGKTTLLKHIAEPERRYVTLDDPLQRQLATEDPALFVQRFPAPVLIDEIQYAPQLLSHIKMRVDETGIKGSYWLIGSQLFHLMQHTSESLAGRVGIVRLLGLSYTELAGKANEPFLPVPDFLYQRRQAREPRSLKELFTLIHRGSAPALHSGGEATDTSIYYASYVQTYLQRDIKDLSQVGDEQSFLRFLTAVAARTGQLLQYADLSRDVGISQPTAKKWLSLLVTSGIVVLVEPWYSNTLTRIVKTPKLFFLDTGLCAYLARWNNPEALEAGTASGAFFETFIVAEILKSWYNAGKIPPVFYYRDKERNEINLILESDGILYPIEIKKSANPGKDAIAAFRFLEKAGRPTGSGAVVCCATEFLPMNASSNLVPWWMV